MTVLFLLLLFYNRQKFKKASDYHVCTVSFFQLGLAFFGLGPTGPADPGKKDK
jgi:hypothetical protein